MKEAESCLFSFVWFLYFKLSVVNTLSFYGQLLCLYVCSSFSETSYSPWIYLHLNVTFQRNKSSAPKNNPTLKLLVRRLLWPVEEILEVVSHSFLTPPTHITVCGRGALGSKADKKVTKQQRQAKQMKALSSKSRKLQPCH